MDGGFDESDEINVLFVDDEKGILEQGKVFLEEKGLAVDVAESAKEALDSFDEKEYEAIISDYQMPVMNGLEFLEDLREKRNSDIPFIMFTGKGREKVAMEALNLGADRYLQKYGDFYQEI